VTWVEETRFHLTCMIFAGISLSCFRMYICS
jgi:hypothetical protein